MTYFVQIVIDSQTPHDLADWWAETLGWQLEPRDEAFIRLMIAEGHATEDDTIVHNGQLFWRAGSAVIAGDEALPGLPRILFAWVPEAKTTKNRVHLDVRAEDAEALRDRVVARGARELWRGNQGPHGWVTFADPEGNEFCI